MLTQTDLAYDAAGNVIQTTGYARNHDASGGTTGALSDNAGSARITYAASYYDDAHRLTHSADYGTNGGSAFTRPGTAPEPNASDNILVTKLAYDTAGRQKDQTDTKGVVTRREYDHLGRLTKLTENYVDGTPGGSGGDAEDRVTSYTYNANGQIVTQTADLPAGQTDQVTTYVYSASLTDKGCPVKSHAYLRAVIYPDSDDGVVSNALNNGTDSTYDRVEMTYHADGSLATKKDQRGVVMTYAYDLAGRPTEQKVTSGGVGGDQQIKTSYTGLGQVEKVTSYSVVDTTVTNEVQHAYNGLGQVTTEYQDHAGAVVILTSLKAQYTYDTTVASNAFTKGLRLKYTTYPNGREVFRVYDGHGGIDDAVSRPTKISDGSAGTPGTALSQYSYMGSGMIVREDYTTPQVRLDLWGGTTGTYTGLDRFDRVVDQQWRNYNAAVDRDRFKYGYDRASNRTYREDSLAATLHDHLYSYDALHRLTDSKRGTLNGTKDAISTLAFAQQWARSPVGNWSTFKQDDNGDTSWELNQSRTHNAANEITAIGTWIAPAYDAAGSMTSGPRPGAETARHHYAYDAWNRLISVKADDGSGSPGSTIATYSYDGLNRRVQKVVAGTPLSTTYDYYYNGDWQLLEERKGGSAYAQYVWGLRYIDAPISRSRDADASPLNGLEEVLFYLGDGNMSVTALIDISGSVVERVTYDAYGRPAFREADWDLQVVSGYANGTASLYDNPVLYCGYRYDPESETYHVRHRPYHPTLGRWARRDRLSATDDLNLYIYTAARSPNTLDPSGLFAITLKFAAFIPKNYGINIAGVPPIVANIHWGQEPQGPLTVLDGIWYFISDKRTFFGTNDHFRVGEQGTTKLFTTVTFDSCDIGRLQQLRPRVTNDADFSFQIEAMHSSGAWSYVPGSLTVGKSSVSPKGSLLYDRTSSESWIEAEVGGAYPFTGLLGINYAPKINYHIAMKVQRDKDGRVWVQVIGSHNHFPAYGLTANSTVIYEWYPDAAGPGIWNLGVSWHNVDSHWTEVR